MIFRKIRKQTRNRTAINMTSRNLHAAYQYCQNMARMHYENFPVASLILPHQLRKHVAAIYVFARMADDLADEGQQSAMNRLQALQDMDNAVKKCLANPASDEPVYLALADTIQRFNLPVELFSDLISAFSQDITKKRYATFNDLLDYCRRSANPVGRLMLHLYKQADADSCHLSDNICTALQLINFFQDLHQDYHEMGRIYIPLQDMTACGVTEQHFQQAISDHSMQRLMQIQYQRAAGLLQRGARLGKQLHGRSGLETRLIIAGGERILHKLEKQENPFSRPRLNLNDKLWMLKTALLP
ncbi:MAG: hydroxysqualene synthase [Pseudomonadota bacterium]|nr:hydroxysqualene synthase [Pseudomonadota bacterium]